MGTFLLYFSKIVPMIFPVTTAIEALVTEAKSGATKKQLALDSLGVATAVAQTVSPTNSAAAVAASALVSHAIDGIVALQNAIKGK
jgi:hypothetical protein